MGYFDVEKNVNEYMKMAEGYDGAELIQILRTYLPTGSTILELGMGPGKDLDILQETYKITGSDSSSVFIELYRKSHPDADLLQLDAVTIDTERTFDGIYSNKVLHHLTEQELKRSLRRQYDILNDGGILFHSFWYGSGVEEFDGLRFTYYTETDLRTILEPFFDILLIVRYKEMEEEDSLYVIGRKLLFE